MGQYFIIANTEKKEYISPSAFGDGMKFMEFGMSRQGTLTALAILLRKSDGTGGGDIDVDAIQFNNAIIGSWGYNRIAIIGDYDTSGKYDRYGACFKDVSHLVMSVMLQDKWLGPILIDHYNSVRDWDTIYTSVVNDALRMLPKYYVTANFKELIRS